MSTFEPVYQSFCQRIDTLHLTRLAIVICLIHTQETINESLISQLR